MIANEKLLLKEYGLKDNEINIILCLVQNQELTAYKIAKLTGIHRSTTYDILDKLIERGFITKKDTEKHSLYFVNDISSIISHIKDKENILLSLIPIFEEIGQNKKQLIKVYQKASGQKEFLYRLFELAKKEIINYHYLISNGHASTLSSNMFIDTMVKDFRNNRFHNKIDFKGIWDISFKKDKIIKTFNFLGENRFLKELPSKSTTMIYGDFVAFAYTTEHPFIIEINNPLIANEMKTYFKFLWNIAKV